MLVLEWGIGLFLGALFLHLVVWRIYKPKSAIKVLLAVFLGVALVGLTVAYLGSTVVESAGIVGLPTLASCFHVLLLSLSLSFSYIVCYTVLEWDSPTLAIISLMARAGKKGLEEAALVEAAARLPFLDSRLQDLIRKGVLTRRDQRVVLAPGPHYFFRSILFYNRLLRRDSASG